MIKYGILTRNEKCEHKKQEWFKMMTDHGTCAKVLRLIEAFMEAAPQLVLQIYIMVMNPSSTDALAGNIIMPCIMSMIMLPSECM